MTGLRDGYEDLRLLHCPSDAPKPAGFPSATQYVADNAPYSYLLNAWNDYFRELLDSDGFAAYLRGRTNVAMLEGIVREPSDTVLFGEKETSSDHYYMDFLEGGGGTVCLHFAIAAHGHWPEFRDLFGATFTRHPWTEEVGVTVEEPTHALEAAFGGKYFRILDEIYQYGAPYDRRRLRVLMSLSPPRCWPRRP